MKKIIIALVLMFSVFGYSQDCKFEKNEVDEFTQNKVMILKGNVIFNNSIITGLYYQVSKINLIKYLTISFNATNVFILEKGNDNIMIKTVDGRIIKFGFNETKISTVKYISGIGTICTCEQKIELNNELFNSLKDIELSKVRIYTKDGYFEKEVKKKKR